MKFITLEEYQKALKVISQYEKQQTMVKLAIYAGCTKDDILKSVCTNLRGKKEYAFWVTKENEIPDRNADGIIIYDTNMNFFELENSRVPCYSFDEAYKKLLKTFKRKGYII